ncbi:MAG: FtsX-like permease family protein [Planctomycetes bacterium]|nr:FtsX-like permease family protein [Planctomycetota bacterium]
MQTLFYIWRNLKRNKLRSILTILSVGFSLALMTVLNGYMAMQGVWGKEAETRNRIVVMNSQGFSGMLPISYVDRVRNTEGVQAASQYAWYGGNYKDEQMPFAQFGVDPKSVFDVWNEMTIDPKQLEEFQKTRNGCVVDRRLAEKRGWKIGERIPLQGTFYRFDLDLVLCGSFDSPQDTGSLWFNWLYLDEGMRAMNAAGTGNSGTIFARVTQSESMASVSQRIDERFASSDNPTRTQTEAAFAQMFTDMLGNVQAYIRNIGLAVVFSLSLVAANAMAMSMRERTTEIAVLKAIGFSRRRVLVTILGEACSITLLGGLLGIFIGCICLELLHTLSSQFMPLSVFEMLGPWLVYLLTTAAGIGFVSGIVPAVRAAQLSVIDGLRRVV